MDSISKKSLRRKFLEIRKNIADKPRKLKDREICKIFYSNISIKKNSKIAFYLSNGNEVNLDLLMEMYQEDGHTICLPCVEETNAPMVFKKYLKGAPLQKNRELGFFEPPTSFGTVTPDVIILPVVAFDSSGNRLGQGGGYYDRTIEQLSSFAEFITIGVAYKEQQAGYLPNDKYDQPVDVIITDERVIICNN